MAELPFEVTPLDAKAHLAESGQAILIDVREPFEHQTARIDGAVLIPMNTIPARVQEIEVLADEHPLVIVFCHHGIRSLNVVAWLRQRGVENCQSMSGGIDQWSIQVDPSVARY